MRVLVFAQHHPVSSSQVAHDRPYPGDLRNRARSTCDLACAPERTCRIKREVPNVANHLQIHAFGLCALGPPPYPQFNTDNKKTRFAGLLETAADLNRRPTPYHSRTGREARARAGPRGHCHGHEIPASPRDLTTRRDPRVPARGRSCVRTSFARVLSEAHNETFRARTASSSDGCFTRCLRPGRAAASPCEPWRRASGRRSGRRIAGISRGMPRRSHRRSWRRRFQRTAPACSRHPR